MTGNDPAGRAGAAAVNPAFLYMDALRAVLALVVAFGHIWALLIADYRPTDDLLVKSLYLAAGFGHPAVILFFVLSGFWITRSILLTPPARWTWSGYLKDRLVRLLLVVVPALLLGGLFDFAGVATSSPTHLGQTGSYVLPRSIATYLTLPDFLGNLVFLQGLVVAPFGSNGPLWSLAYEFWFYIWFPALWFALTQRRFSFALLTLALGIVYPDLFFHFLSWLFGTLLFLVYRWCEANRTRVGAIRDTLWLPGALLFVATLAWGRTGAFAAEDPVLAFSFAMLLLGLLLRRTPALPGIAHLARYGRETSFSLYAIHFPLMALATAALIAAERLPPDPQAIAWALAILAASAFAAWGFARGTESHTARVRDWLGRATSAGTQRLAATESGMVLGRRRHDRR